MGYLQATKTVKIQKIKAQPKKQDIIVYQTSEIIEETENGTLTKKVYKGKNINKIMNESKKLVKANTASEKLAEIERIFTK